MIADRSGVWSGVEKWEWLVGFYPGGSGQHQCGVADSFEAARAAFGTAWSNYLPTCTEADFQVWRDQPAWAKRNNRCRNRIKQFRPSRLTSR